MRLHCRGKFEPADSCFSNPWVAVMLVMRIIVSFVTVFGLLWIFMVKEQPADCRSSSQITRCETEMRILRQVTLSCLFQSRGQLQRWTFGRWEAPLGPNIFLGWVKIHLPGGLIHFLYGSEDETKYSFSCLISSFSDDKS